MSDFFKEIDSIPFEGPDSRNPLAFRYYQADRQVLGKSMQEQLRFAVCYWHTFAWVGSDMFGEGSFKRPWQQPGDEMAMAKLKADVAFEFFSKLGAPFYCFHDADIAPQGRSIKEFTHNFEAMVDILAAKQEQTGIQLLWGTANAFTHRRYISGAASNPDPEVFAYAATQIFNAMNATAQLGGQNYVLWGGREGYETLLNTDLRREREQLGRLMQMVVDYKHKIGFKGTILIEPKPQEPTKHQYDYDVATVYGFLKQFGLEKEIKVNIEANHATLAGHTFQHEVAMANALGIMGSIDANRGDPQSGWDTDQFPNSVEDNTLMLYELLKSGGFGSGGLNFDAKVRRPSIAPTDLFYGHIGGMDTMALALLKAAELIESGQLLDHVEQRYSGWDQLLGQQILRGDYSLASLANYALEHDIDPQPVSGQQEYLENMVNRVIY
ncbi:xylose isomerase [Celerinatantimonas yamalensis]|uniref:Xylose isomerase n=1 Tax=Celerinatantimonas yamalensis TaxID=559956 RepID=A0ABW9G4P3_9GAMM